MKLLIFSDTHGYLDSARDVLRRIGSKVDAVAHLGDHDMDAQELQQEFPSLPFHFVAGNNDFGMDTPSWKMIHMGGRGILLTHGHKQRVYWGMDTISYWAEEHGADAVLFGHTHRPFYDNGGPILILNPGSISLPRNSIPSFGILTIEENGRMEGAVMEYQRDIPFSRIPM